MNTKDINRFWSKVDKAGGEAACWYWGASKTHNGYGEFWVGERKFRAHRFSWILINGEVPDKLYVCHTCDTPACVNPAHLFLGTLKENNADRHRKGRTVIPHYSGEKNGQSKLTAPQVREIRERCGIGKESQGKLAKIFGVTQAQISSIVTFKTWRLIGEGE